MSHLVIADLDDGLQTRLRARAAAHGRTTEDEARTILRAALDTAPPDSGQPAPSNIGTAIRALFAPLGGLDLPDVPREPVREPPRFDP